MNRKQSRGIFYGVFSGFVWAIDTVLIGIILSSTVMLETEQVIFLAPLVSTFLHDFMSTLWMMVYMGLKGQLRTALSKLKTRSGRFVMLGALMGGPLGMTFYVLAVKYIGASYTAAISAIYPAVGAFFAFMFLKERLRSWNWLGLVISISSIIILGFTGDGFATQDYMLGFIFVLICIIGWGLECVICAYGMKDGEVSPEEALQIRQLVSSVTYGLIILPTLGGHFLTKEVMVSSEFILIIFVALIGTASYIFYYKAIHELGPTKAMGLNITYSAWAIWISILVMGTPFSWKLIICCLFIIVGAVLTVADANEFIMRKKYRGEVA
ncbi:DMT family transporter [Bacillus toyonensis]|uniref:EamA family transporter n=1 Tax=Bacillus toyonensis TaxID=155322 RepID=A0A2C4R3D9_9BACI|nr:DMT family transporter [Bacillus toyonensis]PGB00923.1 EamA family transporter [Bacillus toyonensis]PHD71906.1 EamA family transporter [Bacillus toyonensis]